MENNLGVYRSNHLNCKTCNLQIQGLIEWMKTIFHWKGRSMMSQKWKISLQYLGSWHYWVIVHLLATCLNVPRASGQMTCFDDNVTLCKHMTHVWHTYSHDRHDKHDTHDTLSEREEEVMTSVGDTVREWVMMGTWHTCNGLCPASRLCIHRPINKAVKDTLIGLKTQLTANWLWS